METRKAYIRYLSHELRTPLNSGALGINLITEKLECNHDPETRELHETALDVGMALKIAVEILDNLMCYDKIENGILNLRKQDVPLVAFLEESISPFRPQAMHSHINFRLIATTSVESAPRSLAVTPPRTARRAGPVVGDDVAGGEEGKN